MMAGVKYRRDLEHEIGSSDDLLEQCAAQPRFHAPEPTQLEAEIARNAIC
jgi:hypothetical protein